jgi:hypothetical protein
MPSVTVARSASGTAIAIAERADSVMAWERSRMPIYAGDVTCRSSAKQDGQISFSYMRNLASSAVCDSDFAIVKVDSSHIPPSKFSTSPSRGTWVVSITPSGYVNTHSSINTKRRMSCGMWHLCVLAYSRMTVPSSTVGRMSTAGDQEEGDSYQ